MPQKRSKDLTVRIAQAAVRNYIATHASPVWPLPAPPALIPTPPPAPPPVIVPVAVVQTPPVQPPVLIPEPQPIQNVPASLEILPVAQSEIPTPAPSPVGRWYPPTLRDEREIHLTLAVEDGVSQADMLEMLNTIYGPQDEKEEVESQYGLESPSSLTTVYDNMATPRIGSLGTDISRPETPGPDPAFDFCVVENRESKTP